MPEPGAVFPISKTKNSWSTGLINGGEPHFNEGVNFQQETTCLQHLIMQQIPKNSLQVDRAVKLLCVAKEGHLIHDLFTFTQKTRNLLFFGKTGNTPYRV